MKPLAFLFALITALFSEPVTLPEITINGRAYQQVTITMADPATARISHSSGIARVAITDLDEPTRTALGFDPQKAAAQHAANREAQQEANRQAFISAAPNLKIRIISVTPSGIIGRCSLYDPTTKVCLWQGEAFLETYTTDMGYLDGSTHIFKAVRRGSHQFTTVMGATRTIARFLPASSKAAFSRP